MSLEERCPSLISECKFVEDSHERNRVCRSKSGARLWFLSANLSKTRTKEIGCVARRAVPVLISECKFVEDSHERNRVCRSKSGARLWFLSANLIIFLYTAKLLTVLFTQLSQTINSPSVHISVEKRKISTDKDKEKIEKYICLFLSVDILLLD